MSDLVFFEFALKFALFRLFGLYFMLKNCWKEYFAKTRKASEEIQIFMNAKQELQLVIVIVIVEQRKNHLLSRNNLQLGAAVLVLLTQLQP